MTIIPGIWGAEAGELQIQSQPEFLQKETLKGDRDGGRDGGGERESDRQGEKKRRKEYLSLDVF